MRDEAVGGRLRNGQRQTDAQAECLLRGEEWGVGGLGLGEPREGLRQKMERGGERGREGVGAAVL